MIFFAKRCQQVAFAQGPESTQIQSEWKWWCSLGSSTYLQRERMTKDEQEVPLKLRSLRTDPNPP
jgi:hypothetical protein